MTNEPVKLTPEQEAHLIEMVKSGTWHEISGNFLTHKVSEVIEHGYKKLIAIPIELP